MNVPMHRLTLYSSNWHPDEGGAERQLRDVLRGIVDYGWQITVVAGPSTSGRQNADGSGIEVRRIQRGTTSRGQAASTLWDAYHLGRGSRPDVALGSLVSAVVMGGMASARSTKVPFVLRLGGTNLSRFHADPLRRSIGRMIVRGCDAVVINAPHLQSQVGGLRLRRGARIELLRNGVGARLPKQTPVRAGRLTALFYTNGGQEKNEGDFIAIVRQCPHVSFRVVGRCDNLPDEPNLCKVGWCDSLADEFARCDVVLNTSVFEGSPNFCLQALASGRPVLGFDNPGLVDMAEAWPDDVTIVPLHDVVRFVRILEQSPWREHSVTDRPMTIDESVAAWDRLLREVIAARRHRPRSPS